MISATSDRWNSKTTANFGFKWKQNWNIIKGRDHWYLDCNWIYYFAAKIRTLEEQGWKDANKEKEHEKKKTIKRVFDP